MVETLRVVRCRLKTVCPRRNIKAVRMANARPNKFSSLFLSNDQQALLGDNCGDEREPVPFDVDRCFLLWGDNILDTRPGMRSTCRNHCSLLMRLHIEESRGALSYSAPEAFRSLFSVGVEGCEVEVAGYDEHRSHSLKRKRATVIGLIAAYFRRR